MELHPQYHTNSIEKSRNRTASKSLYFIMKKDNHTRYIFPKRPNESPINHRGGKEALHSNKGI